MNSLSEHLSVLELDETVLRRVLARALGRGGDYADIFAESGEGRSLRWEESCVKNAALILTRGAGIRVLQGEKTGFAYADELTEEALMRAADTAAHIASGGGVDPAEFAKAVNGRGDYYQPVRPMEGVELADKIALLERADAAARAVDPAVEKVNASLYHEYRNIIISGSDGLITFDTQPMVRFNVGVVTGKDGKREMAGEGLGGRRGMETLEGDRPEALARKVADMAVRKLDAEDAPAGAMPVVLGAGTSGVLLHEAVGHGLEADFNRKKTSTFSGRVGEQVASPLCSIVDDATIPGDRGAINVDDEGSSTGRNVLVENGVLRGYMHDRLSARIMGVERTGNGRRESYRSPPLPRMTVTYMMPGKSEPGEIIESVKDGFYAKSLGGGQVDIARGDFVFAVTEGYRIRDGKIAELVKGATLIGNGPEIMGKVEMVGNNLELSEGMWTCGKGGQSVPVGQGMPSVKVGEITVGGTKT